MESKKFQMLKPSYLVFDLFQRSIGPKLKVNLIKIDIK